MLERHSGDADNPRILGAFNEETPDWLSFYFFTYFTDRDGKYQLASLRESAFDPLSRTCDFMLKEEAHHMFVGATGIGRVLARTLELMREHDTADVHPHGGINLDLVQKYLNFHYSVSVDLFGAETSTNAANYYSAGLKGRFHEEGRDDDHRLTTVYRQVPEVTDDGIGQREVTQLAGLNETLRDDYTEDCQKGVDRWNRALADAGSDFQLELPHIGFHRRVGTFSGHHVSPDGQLISEAEWGASKESWLPTEADKAHVASLMVGVDEPGKMAGWIAPPASGINQKPVDYDYVKV
jgi:benzoyl-CoA 2,3-dioxygenase component B